MIENIHHNFLYVLQLLRQWMDVHNKFQFQFESREVSFIMNLPKDAYRRLFKMVNLFTLWFKNDFYVLYVTYIRMYTYVYINIFVCMSVCVCVYVPGRLWCCDLDKLASLYLPLGTACVCVCMCVCVYVYLCVHFEQQRIRQSFGLVGGDACPSLDLG